MGGVYLVRRNTHNPHRPLVRKWLRKQKRGRPELPNPVEDQIVRQYFLLVLSGPAPATSKLEPNKTYPELSLIHMSFDATVGTSRTGILICTLLLLTTNFSRPKCYFVAANFCDGLVR